MGISKERIDELFEQMLDNADENGWCIMPEDISEDEEIELSKHLTLITMRDRIDTLLEGINGIIDYTVKIKETLHLYDAMDMITIKTSLNTTKFETQEILIDLHSPNIIEDFFNIQMIDIENDESRAEAEKLKNRMVEMVNLEFKDELERIKNYCGNLIEMTDDLLTEIEEK